MADATWTASMIEERFIEAADVMKRLPEVRVSGYYSLWPKALYDFADLIGQEPSRPRRPLPTPAAISRMEETLGWLQCLDPIDARIVWMRANGERWKLVCGRVGLSRSAANEHWLYALCAIVWRLNGWHLPRSRSKRHLITRTSETD
jgi:hypothetical protein